MNNYIVYKHTSPNGKVYIGLTRQEPSKRWMAGKGYSGNFHFNNAIKKYGWDNFKHEIIMENLTKEEASEREAYFISKYKSDDPQHGYNGTTGGEIGYRLTDTSLRNLKRAHKKLNKDGRNKKRNVGENNANAKRIFQYTKEGVYITSYGSLIDAARCFHSTGKAKSISSARVSIMRAANNTIVSVRGYKAVTRTAYGYVWKYDHPHVHENKAVISERRTGTRPVMKYSKAGKFIKKYNTMQEAADELGVKPAHISQCAQGKRLSAHGFIWIYEDTQNAESLIHEKVLNKMRGGKMWSGENHMAKPVAQYDLDGNYIKTFPSIVDASRTLGIEHTTISACVNKKCKTAGGFVWIKSENKDPKKLEKVIIKGCEKAVSQYSLNGEHLMDFESITDAKIYLGLKTSSSKIGAACNGKRKTAYGYVWKYKEAVENAKIQTA